MKRWLVLFSLVLAVAGLAVFKRPTVETSLFALVGKEGLGVRPEVLNRGSGEIQVLFLAAEKPEALAAAERFHAALPQEACKGIRFKLAGEGIQQILDFYRAHAAGLLAPQDADRLAQGKDAQVRKTASRQWYTSPTSLVPLPEDPFRLLNHFITSRPFSLSGWQAELNGVLAAPVPDGRTAILLSLALHDTLAADPEALIPVVARLKQLAAETATSGVEISLSGVPLHTAETAERCKREITLLSLFSFFIILVTAWVALRSFRVYPYLLLILLLSGVVGAGVTLLAFSSIHLLASVFATTLLGLTIDYAFHGLLAQNPAELRKNLLTSWITTEISLLPLLFSGLPILVQAALFMMSGLAAAFVGVLLTFRPRETAPFAGEAPDRRLPGWTRHLPGAALLLLLPCTAWVSFGTDLQDIYAPSAELRAAEERFYTLTFPGTDRDARGMAVAEGRTIEELIAREEALDLPPGTPRLSAFLPSLARRREAYAAQQRLYATEGPAFAAAFGLSAAPTPPEPPQPWRVETLPPFLRDTLILPAADGAYLTILPNLLPPETLPEGVTFARPRAAIQETIDRLAATTRHLLLGVGALLLGVLVIRFRASAWKIALPSLLAVATVFVLFGTGGRTLTLFHLLACFMLIGISLDYTIFFAADARAALRPITASFVTSLAGFGALAAVSFMVVRSIGEVFAAGLTVAYLAAFLLFRNRAPRADGPAEEATEFAASAVGLQLLSRVYRLFGKFPLDCAGGLIAAVLWMTSPKIRRFTQSRARLFAFVQTMVDKFAVMSQGRGQPQVEVETHPETQQFIADVTAGRGVFMLTSHFGSMEVLPAILNPGADARAGEGKTPPQLYAFMQVEQTAVFNRFYLAQMRRASVHLRPVTGFGMAEFFEAGSLLDEGANVLMAGDRVLGSAASQEVTLAGRRGRFPKGVYRFAKLLEHPIYCVVCYRVRRNRYRVAARAIAPDERMVEQLIDALEPFVRAHPEQWYHWEMLSV